jgi:hypothetical protein
MDLDIKALLQQLGYSFEEIGTSAEMVRQYADRLLTSRGE